MIMLTQNSSSFAPIVPPSSGILISRSVRFGLYVFILPCPLLCTLFLLYHLLKKKKHRQALHNHPLIYLLLSVLLFELIDLPLQMDYLNLGYIRFQSPSVCLIWIFIELWCHAASSLLLTWASFERHILIFHHQWMSKNSHTVVWQKYQLHQPVRWQKYRKMTIQLLIISVCYLFIHFPMTLNVCLALTGSKDLIIIAMEPYLTYLSCYVILLIPFLCLASMWNDTKPWHRRRKIEPFNGKVMNIDQQRKPARMIQ